MHVAVMHVDHSSSAEAFSVLAGWHNLANQGCICGLTPTAGAHAARTHLLLLCPGQPLLLAHMMASESRQLEGLHSARAGNSASGASLSQALHGDGRSIYRGEVESSSCVPYTPSRCDTKDGQICYDQRRLDSDRTSPDGPPHTARRSTKPQHLFENFVCEALLAFSALVYTIWTPRKHPVIC